MILDCGFFILLKKVKLLKNFCCDIYNLIITLIMPSCSKLGAMLLFIIGAKAEEA